MSNFYMPLVIKHQLSIKLLTRIKQHIWSKIQLNIQKNDIPNSGEVKYVDDHGRIITVNWEIIRNALTSDLDISIFIDGLPDDDDQQNAPIIGVQISIPSAENCVIKSEDVNITNWGNELDSVYSSLAEKIQETWNEPSDINK